MMRELMLRRMTFAFLLLNAILHGVDGCHRKPTCVNLTSASGTTCLNDEECIETQQTNSQYACSAPYKLWYGPPSSFVWKEAEQPLSCQAGKWYDGSAVVDQTNHVDCTAMTCAMCTTPPKPSKCEGGKCSGEPTIVALSDEYSCRQLKCPDDKFSINGGTYYIGIIKCDKYKKWKTSTGLEIQSASCNAAMIVICERLYMSTPADSNVDEICVQADYFVSEGLYFCYKPYELWVNVEPNGATPEDIFTKVPSRALGCSTSNEWKLSNGSIISNIRQIDCRIPACATCNSPITPVDKTLTAPLSATATSQPCLSLSCPPGMSFLVNGVAESDRYDGVITCNGKGIYVKSDGTEVLAASCK